MLSKKIVSIIVVVITLTSLNLISSKNKNQINIGKSHWATWDLFEFANKGNKNVNFISYDSYKDIHLNYTNNNVDAALSTIYEAILSVSKGKEVKIISLLDYTNGADMLLAQKEIDTLIKLKDKKIGVEYGSISHFTALKAIEMSGLKKDDVNFIYESMPELIKSFKSKKIDVIATFEPYSTELSKERHVIKLFSSKSIPRKICDIFYINPERVSDKKLISRLSKNWLNISDETLKNKTNIKLKMDSFYTKNNKDYKFSLNGIKVTSEIENKIAFSENGYLFQAINEMMEFMLEHNVIEERINIQQMFK